MFEQILRATINIFSAFVVYSIAGILAVPALRQMNVPIEYDFMTVVSFGFLATLYYEIFK